VYVSIGVVGDQRYRLRGSCATEDQLAPDDREKGVKDLALGSYVHAFVEAHSDGKAGSYRGRRGGRHCSEADV
jgi:hypothetical protein